MTAPTYPDIAAFLTAQLDREQAIAEAITEGEWWLGPVTKARDTIESGNGVVGDLYPGYIDHVLLHDPAKTLAEIASRRAVVAYWRETDDTMRDGGHESVVICSRMHSLDKVLRLLAAPFADQPGYRPEWAVGT